MEVGDMQRFTCLGLASVKLALALEHMLDPENPYLRSKGGLKHYIGSAALATCTSTTPYIGSV
jgi:hypothetical protein